MRLSEVSIRVHAEAPARQVLLDAVPREVVDIETSARDARTEAAHARTTQRRRAPMRPLTLPQVLQKFWCRVRPNLESGCLEWIGSTDGHGYGTLSARGLSRMPIRAHRLAWFSCFGAIPATMNVLHRCDNPSCVNPDHLFLGTQKDNGQDMAAKGRHGAWTHPEQWSRGDEHWTRKHPDILARAAQQGAQTRKVRGINTLRLWRLSHPDLAVLAAQKSGRTRRAQRRLEREG